MVSNTKKLSEEIRSLLLKALNKKDWYYFNNPQLTKCWKEMNCGNTQCPSYKSPNLRCWQVAGTFCEGEPQGDLAKKFKDCQKCKVYQKAIKGDPILQIGEDFNNLMFQLKTQEDELRLSIQNTEEKNRELASLNRKIKRLLKKLDNSNVQLKELSNKDGLTGLYNYRFFSRVLREQYSLSKRYRFPLSCIMIDVDFFKAVNDTYGHQSGDKLRCELAGILIKNVRDTDKVVRYGGEEFAILLPHTDQNDAYIKAERIRILVGEHSFKIRKKKLGVTLSLGIATYPTNKNIRLPERLVGFADKALYKAKEKGRNQTVIYAGKRTLKKKGTEATPESALMERRKNPRIQTLVKVSGLLNSKNLPLCHVVDISCSGVSLLSRKPVEMENIINIELLLPYKRKKMDEMRPIDIEGKVVRCKYINGIACDGDKAKGNYLLGIQFVNISGENSIYLQEHFVSMFNKGCEQ
jgi:diguanylate cyclase (GGDEF)-like protein